MSENTAAAMIPVITAQGLTKHPSATQMMSIHWKTTAQTRRHVKTRANNTHSQEKKKKHEWTNVAVIEILTVLSPLCILSHLTSPSV